VDGDRGRLDRDPAAPHAAGDRTGTLVGRRRRLLVNQVAKRVRPRRRPALAGVPVGRLARRIPKSTSFPSGRAATAAAFAVGAGIELPVLALPLGALVAGVAYSRV
jgi:undecaprenyl-diphosphatase